MSKIHFVLQGKGGVGKSMCAFFLVQFLRRHGREVVAFDADPVNATLYAFASSAGYPVERVDLLDETDMLDPRRFDLLVDQLSRQPERAHSVVDNGSSSFLAAMGYLRESGVFDLLRENGHTVYAHTVITGGQAARDTLNGLEMLEKFFPARPRSSGAIRSSGKFRLRNRHASIYRKAIARCPFGMLSSSWRKNFRSRTPCVRRNRSWCASA